MNEKSYKTLSDVDREGKFAAGHCECPRGNGLCSHMTAAANYDHKKGCPKQAFKILGMLDQEKLLGWMPSHVQIVSNR